MDGPRPKCPVCGFELPPEAIRLVSFDCPHCGKTLAPTRSPRYRWIRGLVCVGAGIAWAWSRGWHDSFMIFVVSFYIWGPLFLWDAMAARFFPPRQFTPVSFPPRTLGL